MNTVLAREIVKGYSVFLALDFPAHVYYNQEPHGMHSYKWNIDVSGAKLHEGGDIQIYLGSYRNCNCNYLLSKR